MIGLLSKLFGVAAPSIEAKTEIRVSAPDVIQLDGATAFPLAKHLIFAQDLPYLNWQAVEQWLETLPNESLKREGWNACELGWLLHLRDALGERYHLAIKEDAALLSSLDTETTQHLQNFMRRTTRQITTILDGITELPGWGHDILIVFDDEESYYRYVAYYYPEDGEFSFSSGMCLHSGCTHFVASQHNLQSIEPIIAHELTHTLVGHLPLPLWLNEGLAVNTEQRICPTPINFQWQQELASKHAKYWNTVKIQEFWQGESFHQPDDGNALSYDLAQRMVQFIAKDWQVFRQFATAAHTEDAGQAAAQEHLGVDLGELAKAILGRDDDENFAPDSSQWATAQKSAQNKMDGVA